MTPFLGVLLLRYGATLLGGNNSLTWFSTGLFVLATGLRPWRHLVQLIVTRTDSLHDIVHHPIVRAPQSTTVDSSERLAVIEAALAELQTSHEKQAAAHGDAIAAVSQVQDAQSKAHAETRAEAQALALAQAKAQSEQKQEPSGPSISELQTILARIEESIENLENQSRNATRANEVVRLESEERYGALNKAIDGLVTDVGELHQRATTVAATAAAASALAGEAIQGAQSAQSAASVAAANAAASANAAARANTSSVERARSPPASGRKATTSLAWTPPAGADSPTFGINGGRDASPSSGRPGAAKRRSNTLIQPAPPQSLVNQILHWSVHALLVPITLCQNLLHNVIAALGVAADPTSPRITKSDLASGPARSNTLSAAAAGVIDVLSPKGKTKVL